jgi:hypothetical protein
MLRRQLERMHGAARPQMVADPYAQEQYARPHPPELPPLRSLQPPAGPPAGPSVGPESMTGVQYDPPRVNGYRPAEPTRF